MLQVPGAPRIALSYLVIRETAKLGLLPDISQEEIKDKSKADLLAKALVIIQAGWLVSQVITRWVFG